jgi:undecaprenyl-diphosphatase
MSLLDAIILGVVQGLTEFFPVSSSGHLVLAEALLGVNPPGVSFEVLVHLATAVSVLLLYSRRLMALLAGAVRREREALGYLGMLIVGSIPAGIVGLTLSDAVAVAFDSPLLVAVMLLITGAVVFATRWLVERGQRESPGWGGAIIVGIAQAFALLPGISRSGFTVAAALGWRVRRERAAEFSFLLSVLDCWNCLSSCKWKRAPASCSFRPRPCPRSSPV